MLREIQESAEFIRGIMAIEPETAIILGSGLGGLSKEITGKTCIPYKDIPNFPVSTVEGHSGELIMGYLGEKPVLAMNGRFHFYEGYDLKQVTFPIRVMRELGIKTLFVSNASGGVNPSFEIGDIMIITDHINFLCDNPLRGKNFPYGPRFLSMHEAYDRQLIAKAERVAKEAGIEIRKGVYLADQGPTYETPAEYRMYRILGADAVGMSTVPEVIVANHCGIRVFGVSIITNVSREDASEEVSHKDVQKIGEMQEPKMMQIMKGLIND